jgi:hypothetical protein
MKTLKTKSLCKIFKLNNLLIYKKIRNPVSSKSLSLVERLRVFKRRPLQIWRWRWNRKSTKPWRSIRFYTPFSVSRVNKVHHRTNFRLMRALTRYVGWKTQKQINLFQLQKLSQWQNQQQNLLRVKYGWFNNNFNTWATFYGVKRNWTVLNKCLQTGVFQVNEKPTYFNVNAPGVSSYFTPIKYNVSVVEKNALIHSLIVDSSFRLSTIHKYNPRLQRDLSSRFLLHK